MSRHQLSLDFMFDYFQSKIDDILVHSISVLTLKEINWVNGPTFGAIQ